MFSSFRFLMFSLPFTSFSLHFLYILPPSEEFFFCFSGNSLIFTGLRSRREGFEKKKVGGDRDLENRLVKKKGGRRLLRGGPAGGSGMFLFSGRGI